MQRNENGEWVFFNREYMPLGWNTTRVNSDNNALKRPFDELPIYTPYKGLGEKKLFALGYDGEDAVRRNDTGEIVKVFFYNDQFNPVDYPSYWPDYIQKIKSLSKCEVRPVYA